MTISPITRNFHLVTATLTACPDCETYHFGKGLCAGCAATRRLPYAATQSPSPAVTGFGVSIFLGSLILTVALAMSTCQ